MLTREVIEKSFLVILHDVTPHFLSEVRTIVDTLRPVIGRQMAAAVVPRWHGDQLNRVTGEFAAEIDQNFGEVLLHGFTHRRTSGSGSVSWLTGDCDEFNGYTHDDAHDRVEEGQGELERAFGKRPAGFIAPTFQMGSLSMHRFHEHSLQYKVGFYGIESVTGGQTPLATWCWDMGHLRFLGVLGDLYGSVRYRLRSNVLPCLAIHPVDVARGFLDRIVRLVSTLLEQGRDPILIEQQAAEAAFLTSR